VGAELFAFCHAEFISASLSVPIYIKMSRDPETILKRVQHRIQGDNIVLSATDTN
jgi:hypothetical protein